MQVKDDNNELSPILAVVCTQDEPETTHSFWQDDKGTAAEKMLNFLIEWARRFPDRKKIALAHKYCIK